MCTQYYEINNYLSSYGHNTTTLVMTTINNVKTEISLTLCVCVYFTTETIYFYGQF